MFKKDFNEEIVLNELYGKISDKKGQIIHNDYDGLISGLFLYNKTKLPLNGIFQINSQKNMDTNLYCNDIEYLNDFVFNDCSIINKNCVTIDHHSVLTQFYNENNYNCNKYTEYKDITKGSNFHHKNPTGNICWLLYLFGEPVDTYTYKQKLMIVLADSLYDNFRKYPSNCRDWLDDMGLQTLYSVLKSDSLEGDIIDLKKELCLYNQGYQILNNNKEFVSNVFDREPITTQLLLDKIADIMDWNKMSLPEFKHKIILENEIKQINEVPKILDGIYLTSAIRSVKDGKVYFSKLKDIKDF